MLNQFSQVFRMHPDYYGPGYENGWFSLAHFIIFLLFVIAGCILVYKLLYGKHKFGLHAPEDPLETAKMRYAKGEITKEEFAEIKKELRS